MKTCCPNMLGEDVTGRQDRWTGPRSTVKMKWLSSKRGMGDGSPQGHWPRGGVCSSLREGWRLWEGDGHTVPRLGREELDKALF